VSTHDDDPATPIILGGPPPEPTPKPYAEMSNVEKLMSILGTFDGPPDPLPDLPVVYGVDPADEPDKTVKAVIRPVLFGRNLHQFKPAPRIFSFRGVKIEGEVLNDADKAIEAGEPVVIRLSGLPLDPGEGDE
jgi:hypothetical protein